MTLEERISKFRKVVEEKKTARDYHIEEDERISEHPEHIEDDSRFLGFYGEGTLSPEQRLEIREALAERYGNDNFDYVDIGSKARVDAKGGPGRCEFISIGNNLVIKIATNNKGLEVLEQNISHYEELNKNSKLGETPAVDWTSKKVRLYDANSKLPTNIHKPFYVVMRYAKGDHVLSDLKDPTIAEQTTDKFFEFLESILIGENNLSIIENQARNSTSLLIYLLENRYTRKYKGISDRAKEERINKFEKIKDKLLEITSEYAKVSRGIQDPADNFMYLDENKEHIVILDQGWSKDVMDFAAENNIEKPYHESPIRSLGRICEYIEREDNISNSIKKRFKDYANDVIYRNRWGNQNDRLALLDFYLGRLHLSIIREFYNQTPANKQRSEYLMDVLLNE